MHWLFFVLPGELRARRDKRVPVTRLVPYWLLAIVAIGPALFVALWPWLWHDTLERFQEYASFHFSHVHYNMAYLGTTYFRPPMPMSYPFVMTLFTLPAITVALGLAGVGLRARALLPPGLAEQLWPRGSARADRQHTDVLIFGTMLAPVLVIAMPWTPIFGGTKHFIAGWAMFALFAGIAAVHVSRALRDRLGELGRRFSRGRARALRRLPARTGGRGHGALPSFRALVLRVSPQAARPARRTSG